MTAAAATTSPLLKSSLCPTARAPSQTYRDQNPALASPSCLEEGLLYVEGIQLQKKNRAPFGQEGVAVPVQHEVILFYLLC